MPGHLTTPLRLSHTGHIMSEMGKGTGTSASPIEEQQSRASSLSEAFSIRRVCRSAREGLLKVMEEDLGERHGRHSQLSLDDGLEGTQYGLISLNHIGRLSAVYIVLHICCTAWLH